MKLSKQKVLLIGDFMVDYYQYGSSNRLSPEAPIPVVNLEKEVIVPGGAGNVAMNLRSLGLDVTCLGFVGDDYWGNKLISILNENQICAKNIEQITGHLTTLKQRVYCDSKQQSRVDQESYLQDWEPKNKLDFNEFDFIILSDYNKGIFHKEWFSLDEKTNVVLDPKNINTHILNSSSIITPNIYELSKISDEVIDSEDTLVKASQKLLSNFNLNYILVTRGEKGITLVGKNNFVEHIKPHFVKNPDVTGAGDTIVAVFSSIYFLTNDVKYAAFIANLAASIVVNKKGTSVIQLEELKKFVKW